MVDLCVTFPGATSDDGRGVDGAGDGGIEELRDAKDSTRQEMELTESRLRRHLFKYVCDCQCSGPSNLVSWSQTPSSRTRSPGSNGMVPSGPIHPTSFLPPSTLTWFGLILTCVCWPFLTLTLTLTLIPFSFPAFHSCLSPVACTVIVLVVIDRPFCAVLLPPQRLSIGWPTQQGSFAWGLRSILGNPRPGRLGSA